MHGRRCGLGCDRLDVPWRQGPRRVRSEPLRPGLGALVPRYTRRMILDRSRPVSPDVHDFDHSSLASAGTTPKRADDVTPPAAQCLAPWTITYSAGVSMPPGSIPRGS